MGKTGTNQKQDVELNNDISGMYGVWVDEYSSKPKRSCVSWVSSEFIKLIERAAHAILGRELGF